MKIILPLSTTFQDYPDNYSHATLVYIMGCEHDCLECQNLDFQDYNYESSVKISPEKLYQILIKWCNRSNTKNIVISGGDGLAPQNLKETNLLLQMFKILPEYNICLYTGYNILQATQLIKYPPTYLKCGRYIHNGKQSSYKNHKEMQLASQNQEFYKWNEKQKIYLLLSKDGKFIFT